MNDYQIAYMKKIIFQRILVDLDEVKEKAYNLYSYVLNSGKLRDKDLLFRIEETIETNQKARMYCQKNIMDMIRIMRDCSSEIENMIDLDIDEEIESVREAGLMSDYDYNEYNYNRDVDSQADEADALASVFGGEE